MGIKSYLIVKNNTTRCHPIKRSKRRNMKLLVPILVLSLALFMSVESYHNEIGDEKINEEAMKILRRNEANDFLRIKTLLKRQQMRDSKKRKVVPNDVYDDDGNRI